MLDKNAIQQHQLCATDQLLTIETCAENVLLTEHMTKQCQNSLQIISRKLDANIFGTAQFVDAIKSLALHNHRTKIQIIVFEPHILVKYTHRLLTLSNRLSSSIEVRKAHHSFSQYNASLMIADMAGYIHRENSARYEGLSNFNDARQCKHFYQTFTDMWALATADPNLRNMLL